jgi:hypothetical protein
MNGLGYQPSGPGQPGGAGQPAGINAGLSAPGLPSGPPPALPGNPSAPQRPGPGLGFPPGGLGSQPGGPASLEPPRTGGQQRQNPAGNGLQYPPERAGQFGGPPQTSQFGGSYGHALYDGPQQQAQMQPPPVAISVGEAVQSAHSEGFGFGEAVARDAPALWLEAVLARKPRMPSDLEARLLQGSALPIDSLLHDEVRHALRRGFWDALERSRH